MRKAARAIIINKDQMLFLHRNKFGNEYDILIGGGIEMGENPEQTLLREIQEESGVEVGQLKLVFIEQAPDPYGLQYIYICQYLSGEPKLDVNSTEYKINQMGVNKYQPVWRNIKDLDKLTIRSPALKDAIIDGINKGFPDQPIDITNYRRE